VIDSMIALLMNRYGFSPETARELISEIDTRALASLTRPYCERAVLKASPKK
jgi:hypothetical protein